MQVDNNRDYNLTDFGRATLKDRYLMKDESYQDLFVRVAKAFADNEEHAQRLYDYMSKLWFMPATPILSNGGTDRGLPISCFLNEVSDDMQGIQSNWQENGWLACRGGGIGTYWGNVRGIGERIGSVGKSSGIVPFIKVQDSLTLAISQGSLRRGSAAVYLNVSHPEIEEFIDIRRPTGGDPNRRCLNLHHGVVVDDKFMNAVEKDLMYDLLSPKDNKPIRSVRARDLWIKMLTARIETGEPYIMFGDTVNAMAPVHQKDLGLKIKTSNLCTEITLPTGIDYNNQQRTAVCCLSSLNVAYFNQWSVDNQFIEDVVRFLDNVLTKFITEAPDTHLNAKYSANMERSIGLGVMGLHDWYQKNNAPWGSELSNFLNQEVFKHIALKCAIANKKLAHERGACPDAQNAGFHDVRFSNMTSIAPTASISIICGGASAGVEPMLANYYNHKTLSGSFAVRNKQLSAVLEMYGKNDDKTWSSIALNEGSVQHLDFLSDHHKAVFRTAFEIDQASIISQAADRQQYIDQAQSINLFLPSDISKKELNTLHMSAWKQNLKTLYYCRSRSITRAEKASEKIERVIIEEQQAPKACSIDNPDCEACQ